MAGLARPHFDKRASLPAKPVDVHVHDVIERRCAGGLFPDAARQHLSRNDLLFVPKQIFEKLELSGS